MRDLWYVNRDLEDRVAERTAALERSLEAARMAARAKERFLADLGHELTTPLHAVLGLLELIDVSTLDDADQHRLVDVRRHAGALSELLRGLVDLAGAEGSSDPDDLEELQPASWLDELIASWTLVAAKRGQLLVPSAPTDAGTVTLDWRRLRRIADVAMNNATVHSAPGGVSIDLELEPDQVVLVIADSGPGMDDAVLATATEPFISHGAGAGLGIGLTIAQRLAVGGGGSIDLANHESTTRVTVTLPRAPAS